MASLTVYRGAYVCATLGCGEIMSRFGVCPHGHASFSLWSDDAEEIEVDLIGYIEPPDPECGIAGGGVCEGAEFEGNEFPLTDKEQERADTEYAEQAEYEAQDFDPRDTRDWMER